MAAKKRSMIEDQENGIRIEEPAVDERVSVFLPRLGSMEDPYRLVTVNGKTYQIPRGKDCMVPKSAFEVVRRSETEAEKADRFLQEKQYAI